MKQIKTLDEALEIIKHQEATIQGLIDFAVEKGILKRKATQEIRVVGQKKAKIIDLDQRRRQRAGFPPF